MKAKRISNPFRKGNQAARKMQVRFFLSLMVLLALVFILDMSCLPVLCWEFTDFPVPHWPP